MHLKSIEIQGFKSFPDYTEIKLSRGITAIVGPNGSGKSNIVDAVRWVLGEQSTKTLRGGKMEDVIFGGTNKRNSASYSEVSLTIDNGEGLLPLEYAEVTITRRYYRSGDSEFYINRKAVRLKDVHELFMDTGLGRDGYSIIGQGRIDEILSVKSGDRREIFEEAAGITKFRYRKEEAEKKLFGTEENLVRIRDIISELEVQVEPLRQQAEKAKQYLLYRDELRVLEVSLWLETLEKLKESQNKTTVDFENATRNLSAKKRELDQLYEEIDSLSQHIHTFDMAIEAERQALSVLNQDMAQAQSRVAVSEINIVNTEENRRSIEQQLLGDENKKASLEQGYADHTRRLEEMEQERIGLNTQLQVLVDEIKGRGEDALSEKLEQCNRTSRQLLQEESRLNAEIEGGKRLLTQMKEGKKDTDALYEELAEKSKQIIQQKTQLEQQVALEKDQEESAGNVVSGFGLLLAGKGKKAEALGASVENLSRSYNTTLDRRNMLRGMERDYEGFSHAVKVLMSAGEKGQLQGIYGTVAQLIKTQERCSTAIEIALGGALQNIVTKTEENAKQAISYLKMREGGRATFLPVAAIRGRVLSEDLSAEPGYVGMAYQLVSYDQTYDPVIKNLLGTTLVAEDIDTAIKIGQRHRGKVRIVTLDGQIVSQSGAMTGGSLGKSTGILTRANEIEKLDGQLTLMEEQLSQEKDAFAEAKRAYESGKYQVDLAQAQLDSAAKALAELYAQIQGHNQLLDSLTQQNTRLAEEKAKGDTRERETAQVLEENQRQITQLVVAIREVNQEIEHIYNEQSSQNQRNSQLQEQMSAIGQQLAGIEGERVSTRNMQKQLSYLIEQAQQDKENRNAVSHGLMEKTAEAKEERKQAQAQLTTIQQAIEAKNQDITRATGNKMEVDGKRNALQRDSQNRNNTILNLERETARLESRKEQEENQVRSILDKMWESYELSSLSAQQVAQPLEDTAEANRRLAQLKGHIKSLGDVNLLAVEEYAKTNERFTFLSVQRDDLEKAKNDILRIISDLTGSMEQTFAEHFALINSSFTTTFKEIFGGGNAHLLLEDEKDILNCGIEIKVELPGKTVKTITLLSGGEKAFVAIALYFAILKVRPTPFCILDEIEAALDDVNVLKYITYMATLCHSTQFIVITHRRGTMEGADMLYGVTMQETGVSKLLAININEMEKIIKLN